MSSALDLYLAGYTSPSTYLRAARIAQRHPFSVETISRLLELANDDAGKVEEWLADDHRKGKAK